jgi:hypothetical protein
MNNIDKIRSDFKKELSATGIYHAKALFNDLPNWETVLNILNLAIRDENPKISFPEETKKNNFEIVYKDLLAIKKLSYELGGSSGHTIESDATFFFSLFFDKDALNSAEFKPIQNQVLELNKILDIETDYGSLKISLSDKFVPYETHSWNTCIIHLTGTNEWKLRNKSVGHEKLYIVERGDMLFFKEGVEHELSNDLPRSSLVGSFILGKSHE